MINGDEKKHRIRILNLIGELGYGGSERQLYLLQKHLDKELFDPHIIVFNRSAHGMLDEKLRQHGVKIDFLPEYQKNVYQRSLYLYRRTRQLSPAIIHSWTIHDNPYASLIGFAAGVPVRIGSVRGSIHLDGFNRLPRLLRWSAVHANPILMVNSPSIAAELYKQGISPRRIHVQMNCAEPQLQNVAAFDFSSFGFTEDATVIGTVGNLRRVKNHIMFIEAFSRVAKDFPNLRGLIVGQPLATEPTLPDELNRKIKGLGIGEKLILTGFQPNVPEILAGLDIFCLTSNSEGTPNALLEAMTASLPVVATRVGGIPKVIEDGIHGFLVEPEVVEATASAIRKLLANPEMAKGMGQAGRKRAEKYFNPDIISRQLADFYLNTLKDKGVSVRGNQGRWQ